LTKSENIFQYILISKQFFFQTLGYYILCVCVWGGGGGGRKERESEKYVVFEGIKKRVKNASCRGPAQNIRRSIIF